MMTTAKTYATVQVANMIAGKLTKHRKESFVVKKVQTGFQVLREAETLLPVIQLEMPAQQVVGVDLATKPDVTVAMPIGGASHSELKKEVAENPFAKKLLWASTESVQFAFKLKAVTPVYLDVWVAPGKFISFGKKAVVGFQVQGDVIHVTMTKAYAKKRGLIS